MVYLKFAGSLKNNLYTAQTSVFLYKQNLHSDFEAIC